MGIAKIDGPRLIRGIGGSLTLSLRLPFANGDVEAAGAEPAAGFSSAGVAQPTVKIVTEQFMIDSGDPGIKLYVRNKRPEDLLQFTSEKTLLFVHGATQPAEATFDLSLEGMSWMDYIAQRGWD
jgi:hypothetical protein